MIKLIIAGSRDFNDYELLEKEVDSFLTDFDIVNELDIEIVSGTARGADRLGERYAKKRNISIKFFVPNWSRNGKSAGYIRNEEMAKYATSCIIFNISRSKGSVHMENIAKKYNLRLKVINL